MVMIETQECSQIGLVKEDTDSIEEAPQQTFRKTYLVQCDNSWIGQLHHDFVFFQWCMQV